MISEQRLAHAQAVIPEEAVEAAAEALFAQSQEGEPYPVKWFDNYASKDHWRAMALAALEAALPHLRGRIGYELGRKEATETAVERLTELATRIAPSNPLPVLGLDTVIRYLRDIGKGDPR